MRSSLKVLFGFIIGSVGLLQICERPVSGSSALFVAGFLILGAINHSSTMDDKTGLRRKNVDAEIIY